MGYNLVDENWIPILWRDGQPGLVGLRSALVDAGRIREVAAPNPMDNVALLRLLLAVLHWCKHTLTDEERAALAQAPGIPEQWLGKLDQNRDRFDILGSATRLYQDPKQATEKPNRPVSDLFAYLPAGTEINHFRHVYDRTAALCPACCAAGLVRLPAAEKQGGSGKSPSINNAPPAYFLPVGRSLLETLTANWPHEGGPVGDDPAWAVGPSEGSDTIGVQEGYTWQPRVTWLGEPRGGTGTSCLRCGAPGALIRSMACKKGRNRKGDDRGWRDPHVAWETDGRTPQRADEETKDRALRGSDPLAYPSREAALWRRTARAVLSPDLNAPPVPALAVGGTEAHPAQDRQVQCFEPFTKQAKTFDEHRDRWRIPRAVWLSAELRNAAQEELVWVGDDLGRYVKRLPGKDKMVVPIAAAIREAVEGTDTQLRLRACFEDLLTELAEAKGEEAVGQARTRWRRQVRGVLRRAVVRTCRAAVIRTRAATSPGSALRRREAQGAALAALDGFFR